MRAKKYMWLIQKYIDALPRATFSEDKPEAKLSQLQQCREDGSTIITIQDHQKQYRFVKRKPNEPEDLTDPHVPRTFRARVVIRAQRLINAIQNSRLPFMPLLAGVTTTEGVPPAKWPADSVFPDDTKVKILGVQMVGNLLSRIVIKDGTPESQVIQDSHEVF